MIEANGAKIIDINMGCPAKKVTSGQSGSALMRTPDFALELVEAVVQATSLDVTLKMRLGWDDNSLNAPEIAKRAEAAGVKMITVHGRTRCQFYKGAADWQAIGRVKRAVSISRHCQWRYCGCDLCAPSFAAIGRRWGHGGTRGSGRALAIGANRVSALWHAGAKDPPRFRPGTGNFTASSGNRGLLWRHAWAEKRPQAFGVVFRWLECGS